jgi:hypothetical protein
MALTGNRNRFSPVKAKSLAFLLAGSSSNSVLAVERVESPGGGDPIQLGLDQPNLSSALRSLASIFKFSLEFQAPLENDKAVTLVHSSDVKAILSNLLRNRNYVIRLSPSGKVEHVVILNGKFGSGAAKGVAKIAPASAAEVAKETSGAF